MAIATASPARDHANLLMTILAKAVLLILLMSRLLAHLITAAIRRQGESS